MLALPPLLHERARWLSDDAAGGGEFVLYWMHHAMRGHENPALDVAIQIGNGLDLPVLVYQGLGGPQPYGSDRHHTFILEGAREVAAELTERGIAHVFHLARDPRAPSPLPALVGRAATVVVEEFPAPPFPRWTRKLAGAAPCPVVAVDAHCVVPMATIGKSYERAFAFRDHIAPELDVRVPRGWDEIDPKTAPFRGRVGFRPLALEDADFADLCAACAIDHSVPPVGHTRGGSRAGYERWDRFALHGLRGYKQSRNDAAIAPPKGVSRISPYLHYGMVSPLRIAREAHTDGSDGAEKFLDELLTWRELAYNLCFHRGEEVESLTVLPDWARRTLESHAADPRPTLHSWEALARGETGDPLWDLAQKSLVVHGELHNNVRMTWGKALLHWTRSPADALRLLLDLNHRYALDGSDPNSYAGILWRLGLFDRPFQPEVPVLGSVRPRSTEEHAERLDLDAYRARIARPVRSQPHSVAVVGAGLAGLSAARALQDQDVAVTVFEKSGAVGGRTRGILIDGVHVDAGAQYFTVRDERFARWVEAWRERGLVDVWDARLATASNGVVSTHGSGNSRFVGVPGMDAMAIHLAEPLNVQLGCGVDRVAMDAGGVEVTSADGHSLGHFDAAVLALPPGALHPLLVDYPELASRVPTPSLYPCWAALLAFDESLNAEFDGLFVDPLPLVWASRDGSKPGRATGERWVLHASPIWSQEWAGADPEVVASEFTAAFFDASGLTPRTPTAVQAYFWQESIAGQPLDQGCLWDAGSRIAVCGDWCAGSRVEGAFLSGHAAAGRLLQFHV